MKSLVTEPHRRSFIRNTMVLLASAAALPALGRGFIFPQNSNGRFTGIDEKKPPILGEMVSEFVRVSHGNFDRLKELLEKEPMLVNASWDWGGGDFETALGAASHMGNQEIATYLLERGARADIFYAAMSGMKDLVKSFVAADPGAVSSAGPHRLTVLYHVAISGDTGMADIVKPHLTKINADYNKAIHAAVRSGHLSMTEWLLKNGADNPNTTDFKGNTPFQLAEKNGQKDLAALLKKYGGK
jgi:hypothetical protein